MTNRNDKSLRSLVSIRAAAKRIGCNAGWLKGVIDAMGIVLFESSNALLMTEADFDRVRAKVEEILLVTA